MKVHILEGTDHSGVRRRSACGRWVSSPSVVMVGRALILAHRKLKEIGAPPVEDDSDALDILQEHWATAADDDFHAIEGALEWLYRG